MKIALQGYGIAIAALELFLCRANQTAGLTLSNLYAYTPDNIALPRLTVFALQHNAWPYIIPALLIALVIAGLSRKVSERLLLHAVGINATVFLFLCIMTVISYAMPLIGFYGGEK